MMRQPPAAIGSVGPSARSILVAAPSPAAAACTAVHSSSPRGCRSARWPWRWTRRWERSQACVSSLPLHPRACGPVCLAPRGSAATGRRRPAAVGRRRSAPLGAAGSAAPRRRGTAAAPRSRSGAGCSGRESAHRRRAERRRRLAKDPRSLARRAGRLDRLADAFSCSLNASSSARLRSSNSASSRRRCSRSASNSAVQRR